jgi:hypothetical protein
MLQQWRKERTGAFFAVTIYGRFCFNVVIRTVIENKFQILLSRFVEIIGFTFLNVTPRFPLTVTDNYKTSITANSSHNCLFLGYHDSSKQIFNMENRFVSSSEHNSAHTFNDPREQLNSKLILSVPSNRSIN